MSGGTATVAALLPDLVVENVNAPLTAAVGGSATVSWRVRNIGPVTTTGRWSDGIYLSTDTTLDAGDTLLKFVSSRSVTPIGGTGGGEGGSSYTLTTSVQIPSGTLPGTYHVIVDADDVNNAQPESDETNNWRADTDDLTVGVPDLTISAITSPATALPGDTLSFDFTVVNQSTTYEAGAIWTDRAVLSGDAVFGNADDIFLGEWENPSSLAPGASYASSQAVTVPDGAGSANYLLIKTDSGLTQDEADETNNVSVRPINSVNQPPESTNDAYTVDEDQTLTVAAPGVLANDNDADGNALTAVLVAGPTSGTLTLGAAGGFVYTPGLNFNGTDSFTYRANDGFASGNVATVTITVSPVNDTPVANNDGYSVNEDAVLTVAAPGVLSNDPDIEGDALSPLLVTGPAHGSLTLNANGSFTYTPAADYNGADFFTYRALDASAGSNVATVNLTINPVNDAPVTVNDAYTTDEDTALTVPAPGVLANDADVEGSPLTAALVSGPSHGTLALNANGSFTYTPAANYNGTDSFTYRPSDGAAQGNVATVNLTINSVNDAPVATLGPTSPGVGGPVTAGGTYYWFRVSYADDGAVDWRSIGGTDVLVTGPGGYSQLATVSNLVAAGSGFQVTYRIAAPGGTWNAQDDGTYTIALRSGEIADTAGLAAPAATLGTVVVNLPDLSPPTASLSAPDVTVPGGAFYWFTVSYADDTAVDWRTIGGSDVLVTGPGGFSQTGTLSNLVAASNGGWQATYRVPAPGGVWDAPDNGTYVVNLRANEVADTTGKFAPAAVLGVFHASFADAVAPTAALTASNVTAGGGASYWFQVAYSDNASVSWSTIDSGDVEVSGPNGFLQSGVLSNLTTSGGVWTATYRITAPGGTFGAEDNGTYAVTMKPNQVSDTSGNWVAAGTLGTGFQVNIAAPVAPASAPVASSSPFSEVTISPVRRTTAARSAYELNDLLA